MKLVCSNCKAELGYSACNLSGLHYEDTCECGTLLQGDFDGPSQGGGSMSGAINRWYQHPDKRGWMRALFTMRRKSHC